LLGLFNRGLLGVDGVDVCRIRGGDGRARDDKGGARTTRRTRKLYSIVRATSISLIDLLNARNPLA
jgi:hypothetical protein